MATIIRVFIVDDQPVFCAGIQAVLETTGDLQFLGKANNLKQLDSWVTENLLDVVLLAANVADDSLLETIFAWKQECEDRKILVILSHAGEVCLHQLRVQGADGCILKTDIPQRFIQAIRSVVEGENWFSRRLMQETLQTQLIRSVTQTNSLVQLTEQDKVILQLICAEKSNLEIAMTMHISERTVCRYLEEIYIKLGVSSRVGASIQTVKMGLA